MGIEVTLILLVLVVVCVVFAWSANRNQKRRASLRKDDESGLWIWTEFDGSSKSSKIHPDEKGGAWYTESSSSDGFDGGDDGGGD